jgi:hypothetical protein
MQALAKVQRFLCSVLRVWKHLQLRRIRRDSGEGSQVIFSRALPVKKYISRSERASAASAMSGAQEHFSEPSEAGLKNQHAPLAQLVEHLE